MHTHTSGTHGHTHRYIGLAAAMVMAVLLSGCFLPDEFDLKFDIPNSSEVSWTYDGKWRFFFDKFDPRNNKIPPKEIDNLTKELGKVPGSTSLSHIDNNVWKQSISSNVKLRNAQGEPVGTTFPFAVRHAGYWLVRITPEGEKSVVVSTVSPPKGKMLEDFIKMGYQSSGTLTINTTGTVEQLSGSKLSKGWFSNSYSGKWNFFEGEPIKLRITW